MIHSVRSIVVIEDNPVDVSILRQALTQHGVPYELHVLRDGDAVRGFAEAPLTFTPCLIVLDLHIPRCDGGTAVRILRTRPALAETPIVAVSSNISAPEREAILALGADLYLEKPLDWDGTLRFAAELLELCDTRLAFAA